MQFITINIAKTKEKHRKIFLFMIQITTSYNVYTSLIYICNKL